MPYSAGTIILQVVPSYLGFQDANEKMAKDLARSLDESLEKGAASGAKKASKRVNEILGEELGKDTDKVGEKSAEQYAGAFRTTLEGAIRKMEKELKPIELRTASEKTLRDLDNVKAALSDLSKVKIEPGMDTRGIERDLIKMRSLLEDLHKNADFDVKWDVDEATKTFDAFRKKVDGYKPKIEVQFESKMADRELGAFEQKLKARLSKAASALGDGVSAELRKVRAEIDSLSGADIGLDISADDAERTMKRIEAELLRIRNSAKNIQVRMDADEALAAFGKIERATGALEKLIKDKLSKAGAALGDSVSREIQEIRARLAALGTKQIGIDISADDFFREAQKIEVELAHLAATTVDIQIHADALEALAEMKAIDTEARKLNGLEPRIKPKVDTKDGEKKLSLFDNLLKKVGIDGRDVANSFRFFNFAALAVASVGAALIPIFSALSAGAIGLGVALVAGAAGLGILAVAFSGIKDAVSALNDQQDKAAKTARDSAKQVKAAAQSVEDAQRGLSRARESAAQSIEDAERNLSRTVEDSAQRQKDAARQVADAKEAASRAIEAAVRRQQDAEENLAQSQRDATQAQKDLVQARVDAAKELADLEDKRKQNQLDQRQAVIDLFNATVENQAAQADPGATNLEKEQADINLKNAQLRVKELRDQQKEMDAQAKKGVNNSDKVKTAQDRLTQALLDQKKAQQDLADADKELTRTRLDNAKSIQDALDNQKQTIAQNAQSIEDAQRSLTRAQVDGQQSIADAQRNLTRAQENYTDTLHQVNAAAEKVAETMGSLGPAGQRFALFIHGLRDDFQDIRNTVQEAFLPPLQEAMTLLQNTYGPELKSFFGTMGKTFGDLALSAAKVFTNKDFQTFFATIGKIAPIITKNFGTAFLTFLQAVANIAVAFAPLAVELSEAFLGWSQAFLDWTKSDEGQKAIQDFLAYVHEIAPDIKEFFLALVGAVLNLAKALAPYGDQLLRGITSFLEFIANMDPKELGAIVAAVLGLVAGFQILAGIISVVSIIAGSTLGLIALAVFAVVAAFVYLYNTNQTFHDFVQRVWPIIKVIISKVFELWQWQITQLYTGFGLLLDAIGWLWKKVLEPFFGWFTKVAKDVWKAVGPLLADIARLFAKIGSDLWYAWSKIISPVLAKLGEIAWNLFKAIMKPALEGIGLLFQGMGALFKTVWDKVISPVFGWIAEKLGIADNMKENGGGLVGAFRAAVGLIGTIWDKLRDIAKKPIDFIVGTVINKGLIGGFNALAKHLPGLDTVDPIPWPPPGFASGGIPDKNYGVRFGYSPGRDNQLIAVGGGEAILRPEATRALGSDWVNAINKRAKLRGVQGVANFMMGFKEGGEVSGGSRRATPSDWARTTWKGHQFDFYTVKLLQAAERLANQVISVTQGSFSTSVAASGSTHAGGGAFDLGWPGGARGNALVAALRMVGAAAWHRNPSQGPWRDHIHGIAIGDPTASPSAKRQVQDYFKGGNGLGGKDDGPNVKKDPSLLDKIKGTVGGFVGWVADALSNPVDWLKGKISGQLDKLTKDWGDNTLTKTLKAIPEKIIEGMAQMISGGLDFITGNGGGGPIKDMVKNLAQTAFGWAGDQWAALDWLVSHESSWNPNAQNPSSTAYGLFQFLDGTWGPYGPKTSDPMLQAQYGMQYIKDRYGDPMHAKAFWEGHHWYKDGGTVPTSGGDVPDNGTMMYDNGGYLPPGVTTVVNLTGKPEPVFTAAQFEGMRGGQGGSGLHYEPHFYNSDLTADDVMDDFRFEVRRLNRGS